jgi:hypothetical protein
MKDSDMPKHDPLKDAQACIVWHPADRAPAPGLISALRNKGMTIIGADDAHTAFAAAQRVAKSAKRTIIVLDTRDELQDAQRLIASIERFTPTVLCWAHEPGANPPLVPLVQPRKTPKPAPSVPQVTSTKKPAAPLRLVGHDDTEPTEESTPKAVSPMSTPPAPSPTPRAPISARDVLDADELDALLAGELGDRKH